MFLGLISLYTKTLQFAENWAQLTYTRINHYPNMISKTFKVEEPLKRVDLYSLTERNSILCSFDLKEVDGGFLKF